MGNYYQGKIEFEIDAEKINIQELVPLIDKHLVLELHCNIYFGFDDLIEKKLYEEEVEHFLNDDFLNDEYEPQYINDWDLDDLKENIDKVKDYPIIDYIITISCCTKHFDDNNCDEKLTEIIKELKPYTNYDADNIGYIGCIHDEDGLYYREFYIDEVELYKEIINRNCICSGCEKNKKKCLCDNYIYCKRAYDIGKEN